MAGDDCHVADPQVKVMKTETLDFNQRRSKCIRCWTGSRAGSGVGTNAGTCI